MNHFKRLTIKWANNQTGIFYRGGKAFYGHRIMIKKPNKTAASTQLSHPALQSK